MLIIFSSRLRFVKETQFKIIKQKRVFIVATYLKFNTVDCF